MKKKVVVASIIVLIVAILIGLLYINKVHSTDSYKFKKEYEKLNNQKNESGKTIRKLSIPTNNLIKYSTAKEIVKKIENKETFIVYFGFAECPWCRSVINNLIQAAKNKNVDTIYYVDVENIRDIKELKDGKVTTTKKGDKHYLELLKKLDNVLTDYTLTDDDNKEVKTGEKRIYAPNVVAVVNGKAEDLESGISKKEKDPYMKLTEAMNKESTKKFECLMKCLEKSNVCTTKTSC